MSGRNYPKIFASGQIGPLRVKNRIVMSPLTTNYADDKGRVTDRLVDFYASRAEALVGLVIVEGAIVHATGRGTLNQLMVDSDDAILGLSQLAAAIQANGAKALLQLLHHGRQTTRLITGTSALAPSEIVDPLYGEIPRKMSRLDIKESVAHFAQAARRARVAGFDGVEIHAAHGYLITSFLSSLSNIREDEYGGDLANRSRFLIQIVREVRSALGNELAIVVRMSAEEFVQGGISIDESCQVAEWLESAGANALDISSGTRATHYRVSPTSGSPEGINLTLAAAIKGTVKVPIITVGTFRTPEFAEDAISSGQTDFVALGRALIADSKWVQKAFSKGELEIVPCIGCNVCAGRRNQPEIRCPVNPTVGLGEHNRTKANSGGRALLVVGGGIAGITAAIRAARRGHRVLLVEPRDTLGGLLALRARTPDQGALSTLIGAYAEILRVEGVDLQLSTRQEEVSSWPADVVATAYPASVGEAHASDGAFTVEQVLAVRDLPGGKWHVRGGSLIAAETAAYLASQGLGVTLTTAGERIAADTNATTRHYVEIMLFRVGVEFAVGVTESAAAGILADWHVSDWTPSASHIKIGDDGVVHLGDDFNPSVLVDLCEQASSWADSLGGTV